MANDELFGGAPDEGARVPARKAAGHGGARPGSGRPANSQNHVNRELREYLVNLTGHDAITEHWRVASMPLLGEDEDKAEAAIKLIMRRAGCSRHEAFKLWHAEAQLVFPKVYPNLGSIELLPAGAFGGAPLDFGPGDFGPGDFGPGLGPNGERRRSALADGAVDAEFTELSDADGEDGEDAPEAAT